MASSLCPGDGLASPHPADPPLPAVQRANRLLAAAWRRKMLPEPVLEPEPLLHAATGDAPADSLGDPASWRPAFEQLLAALPGADLNPLGRALAHGQLVGWLRQRRDAHSLWRAHPQILGRTAPSPIIIAGQMRSGTTRLQRLLACDPRLAHTRLFESMMPAPSRTAFHRRLRARLALAALHRFNPAIAAIHPTTPRAPEEEFGLLSFGFGSTQFEAQWRVPAFSRWWEGRSAEPLFRQVRALVQTIGWSRGLAEDRRWVLKAPAFTEDLPALLATFPDARLIFLDRDQDQLAASSSSLVWHHMRVHSDKADPAWIGREWQRKIALRSDRIRAFRAAHPDVPQIDVGFAAMNEDWQREMERLYAFLGLDLTDEVRAAMRRYLRGARTHDRHHYRPEDFRLAPAQ